MPGAWTWMVRRAWRRIGPAGWAGVLLLLAGLVFWFALLQPALGQAERGRARIRAPLAAPPVVKNQIGDAEQLQQFYRFFPPQSTLPDAMEKLYALAAAKNLLLEQGEYRLLNLPDGKLVRYEMTLPLKGGYLPVRQFVAEALHDLPNLALDGISFNRKKVDEPVVEVQLRLSLYLGGS